MQFVVIFGKKEKPSDEDVQALEKSFEVLNVFLQDSRFIAGDSITIADFSIVTTVSTAEVNLIKPSLKKCINQSFLYP